MNDAVEIIKQSVENAPEVSAKPESNDNNQVKRKTRKARDDDMPYDTSFPEGCPVEPLGINGDDVYFLDQKRQFRTLKAEKLNRGTIMSLFGEMDDLKYTYWPRRSKPTEDGEFKVIGWRPEQAADCLYSQAARKGVWNIAERVRDCGMWRDSKNKIVVHCGDILYHDGKTYAPGVIGNHVYPASSPLMHPVAEKTDTKVGQKLVDILKTWNWRRPEVDPYLLAGWIVAGFVGGALGWRPLVWITGDKATGKSTLHEMIADIFGPSGMIASSDTTAAGISQRVGNSAKPVAVDELEADADNKKAQQVISLARLASSGALKLRGGSDHTGSSFMVRNCFMFSSILIPPLKSQDRSRMAILELDALMKDSKPPVISTEQLNEIGRKIIARIIQQWDRFDYAIGEWKDQMMRSGHGGRGADQFGTLLACLDILLFDEPADAEFMAKWSNLMDRKTLSESEEDEADHERCIKWLLTSYLDLFRSGERKTVASWILTASGKDKIYNTELDISAAKRSLGNIGITICTPKKSGGKICLCVANDHNGLSALFRDSHWKGESGTNGVWVQALRRMSGAFSDQQRFNGIKLRCTSVPLEGLVGEETDGIDNE